MRKLFDLTKGKIIGEVPWLEISLAIERDPNLLKNAIMHLSTSDISSFSTETENLRDVLLEYFKVNEITTSLPVGVSDTVISEHKFICKGNLKDKNGKALSSHKLWFYDKDFLEDDYLGSVITDENGKFEFSFEEKTFRDFGEKFPDFIVKIFRFENGEFKEIISEIELNTFDVEYEEDKVIVSFKDIMID